MGWVWKADKPLRTEEQIAIEVLEVAYERELDDLAAVLGLMCIRQESGFWCPANKKDPSSFNYPHDSESDDGRSVAYLQQQNGAAGDIPPAGKDWWGPMSCRMDLKCSMNTFLERLADDYTTAANNPYKAAQFIQRVQRSYWNGDPNHAGYYGKHWDYCWALLNRVKDQVAQPEKPVEEALPVTTPSGVTPNPAWKGDPVWLPEVLRAFGVKVVEMDGWRDRGHGDFGRIGWVLWHHTGSVNETNEGIAFHPSLGLAANMLIHEDGTVVLTGAGIAWHGGVGIYPGIPEDGINDVSIGIECAYGPDRNGQYTIRWPDIQIQTMVAVGAAISWFLGIPTSAQIAHKEWAGDMNPLGINKQGKPDPGNLDMNWFRGEIGKRLKDGPSGVLQIGGKPKPAEPAPPKQNPRLTPDEAAYESLVQFRGPWNPDKVRPDGSLGDFNGWPQAGQYPDGTNRTFLDGVFARLDEIEAKQDKILKLLEAQHGG